MYLLDAITQSGSRYTIERIGSGELLLRRDNDSPLRGAGDATAWVVRSWQILRGRLVAETSAGAVITTTCIETVRRVALVA